MARRNWRHWWCKHLPWINGWGLIPGLLLGLAALGLVHDGWHTVRRVWHEFHRPGTVYRRPFNDGVAISLNDLERQQQKKAWLPGLDFRGVLLDRPRNDWVLLGEAAAERPRLPLETVAIALRVLRQHLEIPGIDIRPQGSTAGEPQATQGVRYFGGLAGTVVGQWFFQFDYWMKRVSLGYEPVAVPGLPVYWDRLVQSFEREVTSRRGHEPVQWTRHTRYWLCTSDLAANEGDNTLTFEPAVLRVLAERVSTGAATGERTKTPCTSRGSDDALAREFATWLTDHLSAVTHVVPVQEIEDFARLLAGFTWLIEQDPYRDLRPWLRLPHTPVDTPTSVPTLTRQMARAHTVTQLGSQVVQHYRLTLSGGVLIAPTLTRTRVRDNSHRLLHRAVLAARPAGQPALWHFTYTPPSP